MATSAECRRWAGISLLWWTTAQTSPWLTRSPGSTCSSTPAERSSLSPEQVHILITKSSINYTWMTPSSSQSNSKLGNGTRLHLLHPAGDLRHQVCGGRGHGQDVVVVRSAQLGCNVFFNTLHSSHLDLRKATISLFNALVRAMTPLAGSLRFVYFLLSWSLTRLQAQEH